MTDPLQVSVNDIVEMEIGKSICDSNHLGIKLNILVGVSNVEPYDRHAVGPGVFAEISQ